MLTFLFHLYSVVISLKNIDHEKKTLDTLGDIYLIQSNEFTFQKIFTYLSKG